MSEKHQKQEKNFWVGFERPFFVLAPMYNVTDTAFRQIITKYSAPDVIFTEFVSADGLAHPVGREKLKHHLWFDESERRNGQTKIIAQIFGALPENFREAAAFIAQLGFDGIDINMGCPQKKEIAQGVGAALIGETELTRDIIAATKEGAGDIPVSVKTRIGFDREEIDTWIVTLLETDIAALTIHLRTKKEMSDVPAHWESMEKIVALRDEMYEEKKISTRIPVIGNGDVASVADARQKMTDTGCDGVMLGRSIFGNPWLFADDTEDKPVEEKLKVMAEHAMLYEERFTNVKNFAIMKKHFKAYCNGFPEAGAVRAQLMDAKNAAEVREIVETFLAKEAL